MNEGSGADVLGLLLIAALVVLPVLRSIFRRRRRRRWTRRPSSTQKKQRTRHRRQSWERRSPPAATAAASLQAGERCRARVGRVIDGDTVIVNSARGQVRVRLDAIDCPEDGQPWGDTAKAGLIKMIGGREVDLEVHGLDRHGRTLATLYVEHKETRELMNVNERMVMLGHAWVMRMYYKHLTNERKSKLNQLERWARSKKVGLWRNPDAIPPWKWRQGSASDAN